MVPRHPHHHVTHAKISTHATHAKISTHATHAIFFDSRQNFMDHPTHTKISIHAFHAIFLTHVKILQTHAIHKATHPRYPRHPLYLADSERSYQP